MSSTSSDDDLYHIPNFLLLTPEERRAAWERNPPKPAASLGEREEDEETRAFREQLAAEKKAKSYSRIARLKEKEAFEALPKSQRRWDPRKNQWVKA